ncbi:hypothetical protein [Spirosoma pulveris]
MSHNPASDGNGFVARTSPPNFVAIQGRKPLHEASPLSARLK